MPAPCFNTWLARSWIARSARVSWNTTAFSTADAPTDRAGDFVLGDVAIHVTTFPGEAVIDRCRVNIDDGLRPILVTRPERVGVARSIAEQHGLENRFDIFDVEQFVALNLYELGEFAAAGRRTAIEELVARYNAIVEEAENGPQPPDRNSSMKETSEQRSRTMRAVKGKDTGLEMSVRRLVHSIGYRYRLHRGNLPGKPDLVFSSRRKVIFVNGCFWHQHDCPRGSRTPKANHDYWIKKLERTKERDRRI